MTMKRTRKSTSSPDKPTDKSANLDVCVKCEKAVSDDCIMCHWCSQWERRTCANIKQSESVMLDSPSKNIFFFCSSCVVYLPNALSLFTNQYQPDEKFEIRLQSVEDNFLKR